MNMHIVPDEQSPQVTYSTTRPKLHAKGSFITDGLSYVTCMATHLSALASGAYVGWNMAHGDFDPNGLENLLLGAAPFIAGPSLDTLSRLHLARGVDKEFSYISTLKSSVQMHMIVGTVSMLAGAGAGATTKTYQTVCSTLENL